MNNIPQDVRAHRDWLLSFVPTENVTAVVDLGCGTGDDLLALATRNPDTRVRFLGVDVAEKKIATAAAQTAGDARIECQLHRLDGRLSFPDRSFDVVFSNNLVECLENRELFAREVARILRPGGVAVVAHWDWDSQIFDGKDKARVRRLVHAFADWQQPWMDYADGWMGRRLWGTFASTGRFEGTVQARVLTNTEYAAPWYGHARAQDLRALVKRQLATAEDYDAFLEDQSALSAEGRYFYSITGYVYIGIRTPGSR